MLCFINYHFLFFLSFPQNNFNYYVPSNQFPACLCSWTGCMTPFPTPLSDPSLQNFSFCDKVSDWYHTPIHLNLIRISLKKVPIHALEHDPHTPMLTTFTNQLESTPVSSLVHRPNIKPYQHQFQFITSITHKKRRKNLAMLQHQKSHNLKMLVMIKTNHKVRLSIFITHLQPSKKCIPFPSTQRYTSHGIPGLRGSGMIW